jgi:hypothetical protein
MGAITVDSVLSLVFEVARIAAIYEAKKMMGGLLVNYFPVVHA